MIHSEHCKIAQDAWQSEQYLFEKEHPNYCRSCGGWGGIAVRGDSVPYGSTWVSLPDEVEPCPQCQEQGKCPLCGSEMDVETESPCPACGWQWGNSGLPEPPECLCMFMPENSGEDL